MERGKQPRDRNRLKALALVGACVGLGLCAGRSSADVAPGRLVVLDSFADPFAAGHSGALFEADPLAAPDGNAVPLSSSSLLYDARDLVFLPDRRLAVVDRDADPSGLGLDPNFGNGHGAVFVAAATDTSLSLLADGSDYPAGLPPGAPSVFVDPEGLALDGDGSLLVVDRDADPSGLGPDSSGFSGHGALFRVDVATGTVSLVSDGSVSAAGPPPAGATSWFEDPGAVAVAADGRIYVLDTFGDPAGSGGTGAVFEVDPLDGSVRIAVASASFDFPLDLAGRPDGLLALSDPLADPAGDGSRGAVFLADGLAASPEAAVLSFVTDARFRSLQRVDAAPDSGLFVADAFADPLGLGHLGSAWRIPAGGLPALVSTDADYRALSSIAVAPPTEPPPSLLVVQPPNAAQEDVLTLVLDGSGFRGPALVEAGPGVVVTEVRVLSAASAEADVVIDAAAPAGPRTVRLINPDWQPAALAGAFEIIDAPRPVLATVSPESAVQGESLSLTITGANFVDGALVTAGTEVAVAAVRFLSAEALEADLAVDPLASPGPRTVTVENPDGRSGSLVDALLVIEPAPPDLQAVRPSLLPRGESVTAELTGTNFEPGMSADFGAGVTVGAVEVASSASARVRLHALAAAAPGPRSGTLTNPDLRSGTLPAALTVSAAPVVRVVSLRLDDAADGNGDGALDPGESVGLDFELHVSGDTDASGLVVRISDAAPGRGLTVLRSAVPFPDIAAGGNARRPAAPFPELSLNAAASCGEARSVVVEVEAGGVVVTSEPWRIPIGRVETWRRKPVSDGIDSGGRRGQAVALADLDGDGVADLLVGAPREDAFGVFDAGRVLATSGASDDPLWTFEGTELNGRVGSSLAAVGDVDGDGLEDLLVGAPGEALGAGRAYLLSGLDGSVLELAEGEAGSELGAAVALAGDRDLDGRPEFGVGAPGAGSDAGRAIVYSASLDELERLEGGSGERLGEALALIGDGDGDGRDDLAVGAPRAGGGAVVLWRGDGSSLRRVGAEAGERLGTSLAGGFDLDADGAPDLLAGAPGASFGAGRALLLDGADAGDLGELTGTSADDELGAALALVRDLDGDGIPEALIGSPGASADDGRLELISIGTRSLLFLREGTPGSGGRLGESVVTGRDAGGDAFPDFLAGAPLAAVPGVPLAGRAPAFKSQATCLVFEPCLADAFEPNEDFAAAAPVSYGSYPGLTVCRGDADVFRLSPPPGRRGLVRIVFRHADGDLDATLHDSGQVLVDASLSLDDDEELGPFGPGGEPWFVRVSGFEEASNAYELFVVDPDACAPTLTVEGLRVAKGLPGQVVLSWAPSLDPCHQAAPGEPAYAVHASPTADGVVSADPFPAGTGFVEVTAGDVDGNYGDETHVRYAIPGNRYYLVADVGRAGERGPVGHYGR